ncbi:MAG: glycosyltransferase [Planctomycetota bacterium]|jgi:UDP-N-acetylglucosamine transferase subunit ALG13
MIFLTVGTQFPFDRLVKAVDKVAGSNGFNDKIIAQIGDNSYCPENFEGTPSMDKDVFDQHVNKAQSIISHAGMGTITMALDHRKPLLVMPRLKRYGEVVNDHQLAIAKKFEQLGYLLVAYGAEDLPVKMKQLKSFVPQERRPCADIVAARISTFLNELYRSRC